MLMIHAGTNENVHNFIFIRYIGIYSRLCQNFALNSVHCGLKCSLAHVRSVVAKDMMKCIPGHCTPIKSGSNTPGITLGKGIYF
jgi:hypothetical protein